MNAVLAAAEITGAEAVHPGYGFLAENARFAEICEECGLVFIGPPPSAIRLRWGNKSEARRTVAAAGCRSCRDRTVPCAAGRRGWSLASAVGYPVILKASAGGGGRGDAPGVQRP